MPRFIRFAAFSVCAFTLALMLGGCASTRLNKNTTKPLTPAERIKQLEQETQEKDQKIAQMQQELNTLHTSPGSSYGVSYPEPAAGGSRHGSSGSGSSAIRVPGLSVEQLQAALQTAGFYKGSIDGKFGAGTKNAVKRFQRKNGLRADGVVGQKTWSLLKRHSRSASY